MSTSNIKSAVESKTLTVTRTFVSSAESVFEAWLNPDMARRFLFATPTGELVKVEIDARPGGRFLIVRRDNGEDVEHVGTYHSIERPQRLVFDFAVPKFSKQLTQVTIEIEPADNGCILTLTHQGVLPEWAERTQQGWGMILAGLDRRLREYAAVIGPAEVRIERVLPGPIERVWEYLTDSEKRGTWLATGAMEPRVGGRVDFHFRHAELSPHAAAPPAKYANEAADARMHGEVLEWRPPVLLRFTWSEPQNRFSEVAFTLTRLDDGEVRLVITHRKLGGRGSMVGVSGGWHTHLTVLEDILRNRTPAAFWATFNALDGYYEQSIPPE